MSRFCCCSGSPEPEPHTHQIPADPEAGFMPRDDNNQNQPPLYDSIDRGYVPVVPLPRYTPRPVSVHEKTLETNIRNHEHLRHQHLADEKNRQDFEQETNLQSQSTGGSSSSSNSNSNTTMDDASSAYSFPSSFGHTSTETRDTPPPPYSSCGSLSLHSRSRASSVRSHRRSESLFNYPLPTQTQIQSQQTTSTSDFVPTMIAPPPMAHIQPGSVHTPASTYISNNHRQSVSRSSLNEHRLSWESR